MIHLLCNAEFCIFTWGLRPASHPYRVMKSATKLFVTEHDLWVDSIGAHNLALSCVNSRNYSLVGFSRVKLNPKYTWKASTFIAIPKSDFILTSLVFIDRTSFLHFTSPFSPLSKWSKSFTQSFSYLPRILKHKKYKYLILSWDSSFVFGWVGQNPATHFFSWVLHFYGFERIVSCFLLITYGVVCILTNILLGCELFEGQYTSMSCIPDTQYGPGIR